MKKLLYWKWSEIAIYIVTFIIIPIWLFMEFQLNMTQTKVVYCVSDIYCYAHEGGLVVILLFAELIIINNIKYELRDLVVVRMENIHKLWKRVFFKIIKYAVVIVVYVFLVTTIYGVLHFQFQCNWDMRNSNAYYVIGRIAKTIISPYLMMMSFVITLFCEITVMGTFIVLLWWWIGQPIYGYALMIAFISFEKYLYSENISLFFSSLSMREEMFYLQGFSIGKNIIFPVVSVLIAFCVGSAMFKRKDMLN